MPENTHTGQSVHFVFAGSTLSPYVKNVEWPETQNAVSRAAGSDAYDTDALTHKRTDVTIEMLAISGTAGTAIWNALAPGAEGTADYQPEGTASGKRRMYMNAYVKEFRDAAPFDGMAVWSITFGPRGDTTRTFNA